ncbi:histidine phosphatase family protein [Fusibacter bizertensis]
MKLYLVRHGEPSYSPCTVRNLKGQGRDLAALNEEGINQMITITMPQMIGNDAQIILSSPYTRALQSAAIIAAKTGLITKVVHDLHEWIPDLSYNYDSYKSLKSLYQDFYNNRGILPDNEFCTEFTIWEDIESFRNRVNASIKPYLGIYTSAIVVAHGMVIQSLTGRHVGYGEMIQMEYTSDMVFPAWEFTPPKNESKE